MTMSRLHLQERLGLSRSLGFFAVGRTDGNGIEIWNFPHRRIKQYDGRADSENMRLLRFELMMN